MTEQDTDFYEKLIEGSPRLENLELSARFTYDWIANIIKQREDYNQLRSLTVFIHERSIESIIDIIKCSPKLCKFAINGLMHEDRSDETDMVKLIRKLATTLPLLQQFKMRIRTHLLPAFIPIAGHLITELIVDGGNENIYMAGEWDCGNNQLH